MEIKYMCQECSATDSDRGIYGPSPMALFCWKCGAGRFRSKDGRLCSPSEQFQAGVGMLPEEGEDVN